MWQCSKREEEEEHYHLRLARSFLEKNESKFILCGNGLSEGCCQRGGRETCGEKQKVEQS